MDRTWRAIIIALIIWQTGCIARRTQGKDEFESPGDFALGDKEKRETALVDDVQFDEETEAQIDRALIQSSLPLPIKVGKAGSRFDTIPHEALAPSPGTYPIKYGKSCQFSLVTDTVQVDRYLSLANGDLIKMKEGLTAQQTVSVDRGTPFHFRLSTKIKIAPFAPKLAGMCRSEFYGKKTALGNFNLAATTVAFKPSPGSPPAHSVALADDKHAETLFVKWDVKASAPSLVDKYDSPVFLESPFFKMETSRDGFYYLVVRPTISQAKAAH